MASDPEFHPEKLWKSHRRGWAALLMVLMVSTFFVKDNATHLQLSLLTSPESPEFIGTVYPIEKVPDVFARDRGKVYSEYSASDFVDLPSYDPDRLRTPWEDLNLSNSYDYQTYQMKTNYTVVYAGTYELDYLEFNGSHAGVDIIAPKGTPVVATMSGVVYDVTFSQSGFGNLVELLHTDIPGYENEYATFDAVTGYAHLDQIYVSEGDVVQKGQLIGTVGDTGFATAPHIHYQMDIHSIDEFQTGGAQEAAPWHLYWPFTTAEANEVGGFVAAVNSTHFVDNIRRYTINPVEYLEKYYSEDGSAPVVTIEEDEEEEEIEETVEETVEETPEEPEETVTEVEEEEEEEIYAPPFSDIEIDYEEFLEFNTKGSMTLSVVDDSGELVRSPDYNSPIEIEVSDSSILEVFPDELKDSKLSTGQAEINLFAKKEGDVTVTISFLGEVYQTFDILVSSSLTPLDSFAFEMESAPSIGAPQTVAVVALNERDQRITHIDLDEYVQLELLQGEGEFSPNTLSIDDFNHGIATVEFTAESDEPIIMKATAGSISGSSEVIQPSIFTDIASNDEYYVSIQALKQRSVIGGYPDSTFRPDDPVSRVEILKMVNEAFGDGLLNEDLVGDVLTFPDVDSGAWYAIYLATSVQEGLVKGDADTGLFRPADNLNRVEGTKIVSLSLGIDIDPVVTDDYFDDVHRTDWFAHYIQFGKESNILPWDGDNLDPGTPMTRGEVAEMIYRALVMFENDADKYSSKLSLD